MESALQGAKDIIAEYMSDDSEIRKTLRQSIVENAEIETVLVENENSKTYEMYKEYSEPVAKIPSHRILAINRGEKEGCLKVSIKYSEKLAHKLMKQAFVKDNPYTNDLMDEVVEDSFSRLLFPSLENECRNNLTDKADEQAIKMFEVNLKPLLMVAPLKNNIILGLDPAYRTGCKIAVIDKMVMFLTQLSSIQLHLNQRLKKASTNFVNSFSNIMLTSFQSETEQRQKRQKSLLQNSSLKHLNANSITQLSTKREHQFIPHQNLARRNFQTMMFLCVRLFQSLADFKIHLQN